MILVNQPELVGMDLKMIWRYCKNILAGHNNELAKSINGLIQAMEASDEKRKTLFPEPTA